jgi:hypothetical protein
MQRLNMENFFAPVILNMLQNSTLKRITILAQGLVALQYEIIL